MFGSDGNLPWCGSEVEKYVHEKHKTKEIAISQEDSIADMVIKLRELGMGQPS